MRYLAYFIKLVVVTIDIGVSLATLVLSLLGFAAAVVASMLAMVPILGYLLVVLAITGFVLALFGG